MLNSDEDKMLDMGLQLLAHQSALVVAAVHCLLLEWSCFDVSDSSFQLGWF